MDGMNLSTGEGKEGKKHSQATHPLSKNAQLLGMTLQQVLKVLLA